MKLIKRLLLSLLLVPFLVTPLFSEVVRPVVRPVVYNAVWDVTSYGGGETTYVMPEGYDYYVSSTTPLGSDSTGDGSYETPWATIHKAMMNVNSADSTVFVAPGNYYDEGNTAGYVNPSSYTIQFRTTGQVNIRVYETPAYTSYAWRHAGDATGKYVFSGSFYFDMDLLGDGTNNTGKYFIQTIPVGVIVEFIDCELDGGGNNIMFQNVLGTLIQDGCHIHDFIQIQNLVVGSSIDIKNCFIKDCSAIIFGSNVAGITVSMIKNTFKNVGNIGQSGSTTYTNITIKDNIIDFVIVLQNVSAYDVSNNIIYPIDALLEPRTGLTYKGITLEHADFYDNSYFFDVNFTTIPTLSSTSLAIGRASDGGNIGCDQTAGTKQYITPISKKVAVVGDSITYGTGASVLANAYASLLQTDEDLSEYSWITMPGDATRLLGIYGCFSNDTHYMAQEFAVSESASIVTLYIGVNDIKDSITDAIISNQITATIDNLVDLGVDYVLYVGTGIEDADPVSPVYSSAVAIEQAVASAVTEANVTHIGISQLIILEDGWNAETTGLYNDAVHPNNNGHAFIAQKIEDAILATE